MADELGESEQSREVVMAAIAAAGPIGNNRGQWFSKVSDSLTQIAAMISPGSPLRKVADQMDQSSRLFVDYVGIRELEESSQRLIVAFKGKNDGDEEETLRTERIDSARGRAMKRRLETELSEGDTVLAYKYIEDTGKKKAGKPVTVRVLVHFEVISKNSAGNDSPRSASDSRRRGSPSESDPRGEPAVDATLVEAVNELPADKRGPVVKEIRAAGIGFPDPGDRLDEALAICRAVG